MNYRRKGLRALGLSFLAALGLMAFMAAGAQATWLINGTSFHGTEGVDVGEHANINGVLLVPGKNLEIQCNTTTDENIVITELTLTTGTLSFNNCETYFNNFKGHLLRASSCDPTNQPIKAGGKGHIRLNAAGTINYVLFEPTTGLEGVFTKVEFGPLCALTETSEVTGSLLAECGHLSGGGFVGLDCGINQEVQLVREAPNQNATGENDGLFFGENAAKIDGIAKAELSENNPGVPFGGHV